VVDVAFWEAGAKAVAEAKSEATISFIILTVRVVEAEQCKGGRLGNVVQQGFPFNFFLAFDLLNRGSLQVGFQTERNESARQGPIT
jgi:hypothetical protein